MNAPFPAEIDEQEFQAAFSAPPILGVLTNRPRRGYSAPSGGVTFKTYGAEAIDEPKDSFDIVLMFKSLHHVPEAAMDEALSEIRRVLKPGGLAYISEPVFAGNFNEVIRLFHDESIVRLSAFEAVARSVEAQKFELVEENFFANVFELKHFGQFEAGVLNVTHTDHDLTPELMQTVKDKFESYRSEDGYVFQAPNRVDLLRKPFSSSA
jgi:SAM-dependent methyltransferase